jgi:hypothetical protein
LSGTEQFFIKGGIRPGLFRRFVTQLMHRTAKEISVVAGGSRGNILNDLGSNAQVDVNILPGGDSLYQVAAPCCKSIDPPF